MTETDRYDVSGLIEAQYQKGSRGRVLRNLLGISGKRVMDETDVREQRGDTYRRDREDVEATQPTLACLACTATPSARQAADLTPSMAEEEITERVSQASHSAGSCR